MNIKNSTNETGTAQGDVIAIVDDTMVGNGGRDRCLATGVGVGILLSYSSTTPGLGTEVVIVVIID